MNILVVEPHFDDAWINLGGLILSWEVHNVFVLTLSQYATNNENGTDKLREYLPNVDGAFLGYQSLGFDDPHQRHLEKVFQESRYPELFLKMNELDSFDEVRRGIRQFGEGRDVVFWPLGMKHPQHVLMHEMNPFDDFCYYREFPYYFYEDQQGHADRLTSGWTKQVVDISEVVERKIRLLNMAYPSQGFILDLSINGVALSGLKNEVFWKKKITSFA